jgi:DNA-binding PadR family transcriptional regulator
MTSPASPRLKVALHLFEGLGDPSLRRGYLPHSFNQDITIFLVAPLFLLYLEEMRKGEYLGNFELMSLLALMRLGDEAYGVTIAQELEQQTGREVVIASVYATLERLQERGLVTSSLGDSTPERGGRAKRYFRITRAGLKEVREARRSLLNLWKGLPDLKGEEA